jgi:hypothetical protein
MKRKLTVLFLAGAVAMSVALAAIADEKAAPAKAEAKATTVTLTGEVIDTGCYLGHGAAGTKHKECATKCIAGGMPMGLLTAKGDLYLLTPPHGNTDAYAKVKEWAGAQAEITGEVHERNGMKSIEVTGSKPAAAPAAAAK